MYLVFGSWCWITGEKSNKQSDYQNRKCGYRGTNMQLFLADWSVIGFEYNEQ